MLQREFSVTYQLKLRNSFEQNPSWQANSSTSSQENLHTFYRTWRFIITFTRAHHLSLSWARLMPSTPHPPIYLRSILILSFHLCAYFPSNLFPSDFPMKTLYNFFSPHTENMPLQPHFAWFYHASNMWLLLTFSLLDPNIFLSTLCSNAVSLCSPLHVKVQVSQPHKTVKMIFLYILTVRKRIPVWMLAFTK